MNMPDISALQDIINDMGEMDYDELKKKKKGMPAMTKIEVESNAPIKPEAVASALANQQGTEMMAEGGEMPGIGMDRRGTPAGPGMSQGEGENEDEEIRRMIKRRFGGY